MNIIIGLLITILILVLIFVIENFSIFRVVYTTKHINRYFTETFFMDDLLESIENEDNFDLLTPALEKKVIEEMEFELEKFKMSHNRLLLDNAVINTYHYKYISEIRNTFARTLKNLV